MAIFTIRTTRGREKLIMLTLYDKLKDKEKNNVYCLFSPKRLRGYIFVEAMDKESILNVISHIPNIRGILGDEVQIESLNHYFKSKEKKQEFKQNDVVEIIRGPFKKEKAKIKTINTIKKEAKIELINSIVPIPITIKLNQLKQIKKKI